MTNTKSPPDAASERRRQILDAALHVFSTKGFHKATNKDIAQAAGGISPGLIYWYFKDKQDLLLSIMQEKATILQFSAHPERLMPLPPRAGLTLLAQTYLSIFDQPGNIAFFRILLGEVIRFPQIGELFYKVAASKFFGLLDRYLAQYVALGVLRPHDTATAARAFLGMLVAQVVAREAFHQPEALATSNEQIITTLVDIFLGGLESPR